MNIDASLRDRWSRTESGWRIDLPAGWMQGRSCFGGLTAAAMAALGRRAVPDPRRRLRTVDVQLLSPVVAGPMRGEPTVLREGRNITFAAVGVHQHERLVARCTLVFAASLDSALDVAGPPRPAIPDPETLRPLPFVEGLTPEFTRHVDMRWAQGPLPMTGGDEAAFTGMCRYRVPIGGDEGVLALLDTWPAPSLSLANTPTPSSTVTWTAHLIAPPARFDDWFVFRYETLVGSVGLHTVQGRLYDADGTLVGSTEQLVAIFG